MKRGIFEKLVHEALKELPDEFRAKLENIEIVVEPRPSRRDLQRTGIALPGTLFGLYTGIPLTKRSVWHSGTMPDRIIIFQEPIERYARSLDEMAELIRDTVRHEIGHYFGIGEDRLRQIEYERTHRRHRGQRG